MTWLVWILNGVLIAEIIAYGFLYKALMWRYRDVHRMHTTIRTIAMIVMAKEPWYIKGVDKVIGRWLN